MRWMIEIGRVDIATEVSMLSSFLSMPRVGHLEAAINIMGYLRLHHNSQLFLDPTYPVLDHSYFNDGAEWAELYGGATEAIPLNMPAPSWKDIDLRDSDHAGDKYPVRDRHVYLSPAWSLSHIRRRSISFQLGADMFNGIASVASP